MGASSASHWWELFTTRTSRTPQPAKPSGPGIDEGIVKGLYRFNTAESADLSPVANAPRIQLLGSGTAIHWVLAAQKLLAPFTDIEWGSGNWPKGQ